LRHQARGCRRFRRTFREAVSRQFQFQFTEAEQAYRLLAEQPLLAEVGPVDATPPAPGRQPVATHGGASRG
jgi:hypothetical protein